MTPGTSPPPDPSGANTSNRSLPPAGATSAADDGIRRQRAIQAWIAQNEMVALLGGFAVGVFVGVLMRR